ncbi:MAG: Trm112 family protein [Desulfatibacillum sp.]|nr:Trm112 family protein [Desulfatibacillum sp.]
MPVNKDFLEILACPKCKGKLELNEKENGLICRPCKLVYEIRDQIPIMLADQAKPLEA